MTATPPREGDADRRATRVPHEVRCPTHRVPLTTDDGGDLVSAATGLLAGSCGCRFPVVGGIPRFVEPANYAAGFGLQWKAFARTQLDSHTGLRISRDRLERCIGGSLEVLRGRSVLEAGCGAGRFTELLLSAGARVVAADLSVAVEANHANCARDDGYFVCQADLRALPVAPASFDLVVCLGVVQHTPDPEATIAALASYVRPGGLLVIDHYAPDYPLPLSRRLLRSVLLRLPPAGAKAIAVAVAKAVLPVHRALWRDARGMFRLRGYLRRLSPLVDYYDDYPQLGRDRLAEWSVLDTHDTLTDRYKHLRSVEQIREALERAGCERIRVEPGGNGVEARARRPVPGPAAAPVGS
jgi:SAM-dependent methyltransferase